MMMKNNEEPLEETTAINTETLAMILAIFDMAKESNVLPEICNGFQRNVYDELSSQNMWSEQNRNFLMHMIRINLGILKDYKLMDKELETRLDTKLLMDAWGRDNNEDQQRGDEQ